MMGQSETLSSSQIIFPTLFSACAQCFCAFHQPLQICIYAKPNQHVLTVLDPISLCKLIYRDALICTHWCTRSTAAPTMVQTTWVLGNLDAVMICKNCPTFLKPSLSILGKWYDKSLYGHNILWAGSLTSSKVSPDDSFIEDYMKQW
jgi:hypothetical protein